jgi:pyruvate dehydrogenase E2 component (dihydrolipoamide acetyltransferase)
MAELIKMPRMSDTMTEGVIDSWVKKVGDTVKSGDVLAEVETDKATMELESYTDGVLLYIGVKEGETVPVDAVIAVIGKQGEDYQSLLNQGPAAPAASGTSGADSAKTPASEAAKEEVKKEEAPAPENKNAEAPVQETKKEEAPAQAPAAESKPAPEPKPAEAPKENNGAENGRLMASPLAKKNSRRKRNSFR